MKNAKNTLLEYLDKSPCSFLAVKTVRTHLDEQGFTYLKEGDNWNLEMGGKYYTVRNGSSLIAFTLPEEMKDYHFQIVSAHTDSPTYKVKDEAELNGPGEYLKLNTEGYGGMIDSTWLDRPLTVAGRVLVRENGKAVSKLVFIDKDILIIPNMPIHFNREVNNGYKFNRQVDLIPMFSAGKLPKGSFTKMLADEIGTDAENIISKEIFLVNREKAKLWGLNDEFISSGRLDDLEAVFTSLLGFTSAKKNGAVNIFAAFDNEEVGSNTKQGAMSTLLKSVVERINCSLGKDKCDLYSATAKSFMISFDNAHAVHPNHPEKYDEKNRCYMNHGIVIKENANQKYTTDAFSSALFKELCKASDVPFQVFTNRSDIQGGSTLGNISNVEVSLHAVDIGLPQLAMHSSYETAGADDICYAVKAICEFYSRDILISEAESFEI
ncbi:MAG: M18 family aminopeptidase [Clostridia bacterium]|nr:M18 family aminopeptidase [Clostridia bacterium]